MHKRFSQELLLICLFSITILVFTLELQIKCHFSGLAFIWLALNYLKIVFGHFVHLNRHPQEKEYGHLYS